MENVDLKKIKKVFFIGIGGIGISALAKMALAEGMEISGINDDDSPDTIRPLQAHGVEVIFQKDVKGVFEVPEADLYVYSDAWLYRGPQIIESAKATGKPVLSYFEALGIFAKNYKVIAISGTHGKTTTTAMIAQMMVDAGLDPTVVVGSIVKKWMSNFRKGLPAQAGKSKYLVVEADEYMRHFLNFYPFIGVVTNIEADHLDYYKDLADIKTAFNKFISQSEHSIVDYTKYSDKVPKLSVPGVHNRMNAAAALAVAEVLGIPEEVAKKSLAGFEGTWRRLEKKGMTPEGTIIYDDYSHHPTEVQAAIGALRELYLDKTITIFFQPHLYSRTKALFDDFAKCFNGTDRVMLLPIYFARESKDESVSSEKLAEAINKNGVKTEAFPDFASAERAVSDLKLGPNDVFVTMGAGEAYKVAEKVFPHTY